MKGLKPALYRSILLVLVFSWIPHLLFSQGLNQGYKALEEYNYFLAKKVFSKKMKNYPVTAGYGLSQIYFRKDNPFHNYDSAYTTINLVIDNLPGTKSDQKEMLRYGINLQKITAHLKNIEKNAFEEIIVSKDTSRLNHYIKRYSLSTYVPEAVRIRDSLAYESVVRINTAEAYKNYISTYPSSAYLFEARERFQHSLYIEHTAAKSLAAYENFIRQFPESPYKKNAEEELYKLNINDSSDINEYYSFVKKYPDNSFSDEAWQNIYSLHMLNFHENAFREFIAKYPEYPYMDRLKEDYLLAGTTLVPVIQDSLWGYIDTNGEIKVDAKYQYADYFYENMAIVGLNGKLGYITKSGEEVIPPFYDDAERFHNNLAIVKEHGKAGVVDRNGKMPVSLRYEEISDFENGVAVCFDGNYYGYIDKKGKVIIPFKFDGAGDFRDNVAICEVNGSYGLINLNGDTLLLFEFEGIEHIGSNRLRIRRDEMTGLASVRGEIFVSPYYDEIGNFSSNRALVKRKGRIGFIDTTGIIVVPLSFEAEASSLSKSDFINGYAAVRYSGKYGVIDSSGKNIVPYRYDDIIMNDAQIVSVRKGKKWGYLNVKDRKLAMEFKYDFAGSFNNKFAIVKFNNKSGIINMNGDAVIPFNYERIEHANGGYFVVWKDGKCGLSGFNGILIAPEFEKFEIYNEKLIRFSKPGSVSWLDLQTGKIFWQ